MVYQRSNKTVYLSYVNGEDIDLFDPSIDLEDIEQVIEPVLWNLPNYLQILISVTGWCLIVIGSYFRLIVYKHLFKEYNAKQLTSINVLTIVYCFIQHSAVLSYQIYETLVVSYSGNLQNFAGYWFCNGVRFVFGYEMVYSIVGGFGMALYRILLIKYDQFIKYKIGENSLLWAILLSGLLFVLFVIIMFIVADDMGFMSENCIMSPGSEVLDILGNYQRSSGFLPTYFYWKQFRFFLILAMSSITLSEIAIYISFFYHLYKHDNSPSIRSLLEPKVIKSRNKKNALTFFSQFCTFVFEISFLMLMIFAALVSHNSKEKFVIAILLKKIAFASISTVEVLTSRKNLKVKLF